MSTKLYVMIKGRTKGPFSLDKLRQLAEQNQLSKMHQVSDDQMTWIAAGDYEGGLLWQHWESEPEPEPEPEPETGPPPESEWYYTRNGVQLGPIGLAELKNLFGCGELKPDEQVWSEGMEHWKAAGEVPELRPYFKGSDSAGTATPEDIVIVDDNVETEPTRPDSNGRQKSSSDELSLQLCKIANKSRGWTIFIAIVCFLLAAVFLLQGITDLVRGIKHELDLVIAMGIGGIIHCGIQTTGGLFLLFYSNKMSAFKHKRKEAQLRIALSALNRFWLFVSIVLIVSISVGILLGVIVGLQNA